MPGTVDGIDLARYLVKRHPNIPVIITFGHVNGQELPFDLGPLIEKPYLPRKVLEIIKSALASTQLEP